MLPRWRSVLDALGELEAFRGKRRSQLPALLLVVPPTHTQLRSRILLAQRTNSLAAMESPQKRQRTAATTMQRVCELPKELQGRILMMALEAPSATLVKAAIGEAHGEPRWWATLLGHDKGHQNYLNRHTHCHRLGSRAGGAQRLPGLGVESEQCVREPDRPRSPERRLARLGKRNERQEAPWGRSPCRHVCGSQRPRARAAPRHAAIALLDACASWDVH